MAGYGGETPLVKFGLTLTVESPDGTSVAAPVEQGDLFKLGGTAFDSTGYKLVALAADDSPSSCVVVQASNRTIAVGTLGVIVISPYTQVRKFAYYTGAAPSIGQSIATTASNVRKVKGKTFNGPDGYVLAVDTANLTVEVLV